MPATQNAPLRLPEAFRRKRGLAKDRRYVHQVMRRSTLNTVCEEARCPNIGECFAANTATFMIMGDTCTRRCNFCSVKTGRPEALDPNEPENLARAVGQLGLKHVVITSVDRDELPDYGAAHFAACIRAVKETYHNVDVEILTPDFKGNSAAIDVVLHAQPDVFNHNIESVARLYKQVRPQSDWETTKGLLRYVASQGHGAVKSGFMVGLGEEDHEVEETMTTLKDLGVHIVTIGQYLRPTLQQWPVSRYVEAAQYEKWKALGKSLGFDYVFAGPFVRSSYHAAEALAHAKKQEPASSVKRVQDSARPSLNILH
jgi:lipoic acid synthetase